MREVWLLRHAQKNYRNELTAGGETQAVEKRSSLPEFEAVISSPAGRTQRTAELLSGQHPMEDRRAGLEVEQPAKLNELIDELLVELKDGQKALVVSHDPIIGIAMAARGASSAVIGPLEGFVISDGEPRLRQIR
jgi:broad specificity phosphatase PhoE